MNAATNRVTAETVTHDQLIALRREASANGDYAVSAIVDFVVYGDALDGDDWEPGTARILNRLGAASWTAEQAKAYCADLITYTAREAAAE